MPRPLLSVLVLLAALGACKRESAPARADAGGTAPAAGEVAVPAGPDFTGTIDAASYGALVQTLASDAFEGRGPGTPGEDRTVTYIRDQMQRIGLQPGNGDSWYQDVPMVETTAAPATAPVVTPDDGQARPLAFGSDVILGTRSGKAEVRLADSPMVFVGYGVDAPERGWNDYGDQDWTGKTVVMFVNDPGFQSGQDTLFDGARMTYYGRWTYKFEEAARRHAAAALIVHDTPGAGYDWDVVRSSWSGPQYDLPTADDPAPRLAVQGWLSQDAARRLFADAGLDLQQAYRDAGRRGFRPVPLQARFSVDLRSTVAEKKSRNVVGVLPGTSRADEAMVYMAHWDHLGRHAGEDGDAIYNGAVDNATGVAGILEIADAFAHQQPRPQRSVVFLAVTLEEAGLLGSQYYVAHPTFPLDRIAGVVNLDAMSVAGRARDMTVVGYGSSQLEDLLRRAARAQGRVLHGEADPQNGAYFRSDHFSFARAGVPALYADGGEDLREGGVAAGRRAAQAYAARYHSPADEYDPATWKLDGVVEDLQALYAVGRELVAGGQWPAWSPDSPFKATRERMMAARPDLPPPAATR